MQFNSIEFIFCFLPVMLIAYRLFPENKRSIPLIAGSLIYYGYSCGEDLWAVAVLVIGTLFTYLVGLALGKSARGSVLALSMGAITAVLIFFKLYMGGRYLPAGMSFYLFQMAAYLIDIYRQRMQPIRSIASYGEKILMFPKLLSGPLVELRSLRSGEHSAQWFHSGLQLLILGLGIKVILASRVGSLWAETGIAGYAYISVPLAWIALISYAMQMFFDFYGYSLIAVGLGRMLGFDLPHNFLDPYASRSVSEFFRRWHATLGAWFRAYVYIPLGGNRKGTARTILNIAIVWLLTGLWHGLGGNYILWAGFVFLFIMLERLFIGKLLDRTRVLCHLYTVAVILISWVPFAIGDWDQMVVFLGRLFGLTGEPVNPRDYISVVGSDALLLMIGAFFATPFPRRIWHKLKNTVIADILMVCLFWAVVYFIATAAQDPFLYFKF